MNANSCLIKSAFAVANHYYCLLADTMINATCYSVLRMKRANCNVSAAKVGKDQLVQQQQKHVSDYL